MQDHPEVWNIVSTYKEHSFFHFSPKDQLKAVCNAPSDKAGIYIVYGCFNGERELIYIGSSGHVTNDGSIHVRTSGLGGIKDRVVNGHHFNKEKRNISWPRQMIAEKIEMLEIHWYVTHNADLIHSPCYVEHCLLHAYLNAEKRLPRWNKKF
jgi:hypothetical protein